MCDSACSIPELLVRILHLSSFFYYVRKEGVKPQFRNKKIHCGKTLDTESLIKLQISQNLIKV
jgi:hypothetical protein